jgi:hypothetical protein
LNDSQHKTIRRLAEAGFIKVTFIAPRVWLLDLASWNQHVERVSADPWFWDPEGKNLARYRGTYRVRRRA